MRTGSPVLERAISQCPGLSMLTLLDPLFSKLTPSHAGLGAVLSQDQEGQRRPIAFGSRGLRLSTLYV